MDASADRAFIAIDFNGNGIRAYSFSVTLGGSISDAVWANENQPSLDWMQFGTLKHLKPMMLGLLSS